MVVSVVRTVRMRFHVANTWHSRAKLFEVYAHTY